MMDHGGCLRIDLEKLPQAIVTIFAEVFHPAYSEVIPTLRTLAEPISRPRFIHEFRITPFSLGAAVAVGITATKAYDFLERNCHVSQRNDRYLFGQLREFFNLVMRNFDKARLVYDGDRIFIETVQEDISHFLRTDPTIASVSVGNIVLVRMDAQSVMNTQETAKERMRAEEVPSKKTKQVAVKKEEFTEEEQDKSALEEGDGASNEYEEYYRFELKDIAAAQLAVAQALALGYPIQRQYSYFNDQTIKDISLVLRTSTKPRDYQKRAVEAAVGHGGRCSSGVIVLPCGAGKTLLGILLMCCVKKPTLVICASAVSVEQWAAQLREYATFDDTTVRNAASSLPDSGSPTQRPGGRGKTRVACLTGKLKDAITDSTDIVITTYNMLAVGHRRLEKKKWSSTKIVTQSTSDHANNAPSTTTTSGSPKFKRDGQEEILLRSWGLMLLDEVHVVPADFFKEAMSFVNARTSIGLTATYVREDNKISNLYSLVGPKLFDVSWEDLCAQGYLAQVLCTEVHCAMSLEFQSEYSSQLSFTLQRKAASADRPSSMTRMPILSAIAAANPNKMFCTKALLQRHQGAKTLVFCDHILLLKEYASYFNCPYVCGDTQHSDRMKIFSDFQCTSKLNLICISRVGDVSVNLPAASVVVQVSSHGGSRRQETQRLGRILRPKERASDGKMVKAFFYSLVSDGTIEVNYASRRQEFLVDQGYQCRIQHFPFEEEGESKNVLNVKTEEAQTDDQGTSASMTLHRWKLDMLAKVVAQWELVTQSNMRWSDRKRKAQRHDRTLEEEEGSGDGASSDEDDVIEVPPPHHSSQIKPEPKDPSTGERRWRPMSDFTYGEDDVVYHEFDVQM